MITDYFNTPIIIKNRVQSKDARGQVLNTYTSQPAIKAGVFKSGSTRVFKLGKQEYQVDYNVYTPTSAVVKEGDNIEIKGIDYQVLFVLDTNFIGHHLKIGVTKL